METTKFPNRTGTRLSRVPHMRVPVSVIPGENLGLIRWRKSSGFFVLGCRAHLHFNMMHSAGGGWLGRLPHRTSTFHFQLRRPFCSPFNHFCRLPEECLNYISIQNPMLPELRSCHLLNPLTIPSPLSPPQLLQYLPPRLTHPLDYALQPPHLLLQSLYHHLLLPDTHPPTVNHPLRDPLPRLCDPEFNP